MLVDTAARLDADYGALFTITTTDLAVATLLSQL